MTRQVDPNVRDNFHIRARTETERQIIGDLKQLAQQDEVELVDLVIEGIQYMFKAHNWPPENPQTQLSSHQQTNPYQMEKCKCNRTAVIWITQVATKTKYCFCQTCFSKVPLRFDPKIWKITLDQRKPLNQI